MHTDKKNDFVNKINLNILYPKYDAKLADIYFFLFILIYIFGPQIKQKAVQKKSSAKYEIRVQNYETLTWHQKLIQYLQ